VNLYSASHDVMIRKKTTPQSGQIRQNNSNKSTDQPTPSISKKKPS